MWHPFGPLAGVLAQRQILLSASLLVLVAGFAHGPASGPGGALILAHFGLFMLWQPMVRPNYRFALPDTLLLLGLLSVFIFALSPATLALWVLFLASVIGGRSFVASSRAGRLPYLIAVVALVLFLVLVLMPAALALETEDVALFSTLATIGLPLMAVAVAFFPVESDFDPQTVGGIDLLSSLMLFLALAVTLLGALALMQVRGLAYFQALALAFLAMAACLMLLALAWYPRLGLGGLGVQLSRRMLSSGVSFDHWLNALASAALREPDPEPFLQAALDDLLRFPGIVGGQWRSEVSGASGRFGAGGNIVERFTHAGLSVELGFERRPGDGLLWHYDLMLLVLAEFYREKCQTRLLQLRSFEEAVHETGARLTHDVKNLLQSLSALCFAAAAPEGDAAALQRLFRRQLPQIAARLESTLEKLRRPDEAPLAEVGLADWWRGARARHAGQGIDFGPELPDAGRRIPQDVYDSCLDNLLQNAITKRQLEPGLKITVGLEHGGRLRVADDGSAIADELAMALMRQPIPSQQGFGMGLYQAAKLARRAGCKLALASNQDGAVVFELDCDCVEAAGGIAAAPG